MTEGSYRVGPSLNPRRFLPSKRACHHQSTLSFSILGDLSGGVTVVKGFHSGDSIQDLTLIALSTRVWAFHSPAAKRETSILFWTIQS